MRDAQSSPAPGKVRLRAGRAVQSSLIGYRENKKKGKKEKQAPRLSPAHSAMSLKHKTIKSTFAFFPSSALPFLPGSGEPKSAFHHCCEEAAGRLTPRIGRVQFQCPIRKERKKNPKQTVLMISTSHHSPVLLPASDKDSQLLPRRHLGDSKPPLVPSAEVQLQSPQHPGSRAHTALARQLGAEGRAALGHPRVKLLVAPFLSVNSLGRLSRFLSGFELEIFCGFPGREQA